MIGWYFDIVLGYLIRSLVRFVKLRRSETWPVEKGKLLNATCPAISFGGPVAEFRYTYIHKGEYYSGVHAKAFMLRSSAEEYAGQFPTGAEIPVRVNPTQPEISVIVE
jgi:hypothetical protein